MPPTPKAAMTAVILTSKHTSAMKQIATPHTTMRTMFTTIEVCERDTLSSASSRCIALMARWHRTATTSTTTAAMRILPHTFESVMYVTKFASCSMTASIIFPLDIREPSAVANRRIG